MSMTVNGQRKQLEDWSKINWVQTKKVVINLPHRIFRAKQIGNFRQLRNLPKLMLRSSANLLLAVRQITQTNEGKKTAGIDNEVSNTPARPKSEICSELPWNKTQSYKAGNDSQTKWQKASSWYPKH